jgi:hypothetical protein
MPYAQINSRYIHVLNGKKIIKEIRRACIQSGRGRDSYEIIRWQKNDSVLYGKAIKRNSKETRREKCTRSIYSRQGSYPRHNFLSNG